MQRLVVLITVALSMCPAVRAEEADVYLLAGQSNMQGLGRVARLPEAWRSPLDGVRFWNGEAFEPLDPSTTRISSRAGEFGPELGFARGLRDGGQPRGLHLVKFHRSGQPLHHGWDGNRWVGGEAQPGRRNFHPGR